MNKPAAIQAQLVDVRNLGTEKCVKLTLHVPAESAMQVVEAFGWPTAVTPVPVAVARLTATKTHSQESPPTAPASHDRRPFSSLPLPQQAALLCGDPVFRAFLNEEFGYNCDTSDEAAEAVRERCHVRSRSDIKPDTSAGTLFIQDREHFQAWKLVSA